MRRVIVLGVIAGLCGGCVATANAGDVTVHVYHHVVEMPARPSLWSRLFGSRKPRQVEVVQPAEAKPAPVVPFTTKTTALPVSGTDGTVTITIK